MDPIRISAPLLGAGQAPLMPGPTNPDPAMVAARDFAQTLARAERISTDALTTGADPHDLMTAIAESKLALEAVVAMRDRAVEAYQEILRMPV
jgi:flagellar hook-basal body complex protein FliE